MNISNRLCIKIVKTSIKLTSNVKIYIQNNALIIFLYNGNNNFEN